MKKLLTVVLLIVLLSLPLYVLVHQILSVSHATQSEQVYSRLLFEAQAVNAKFSDRLVQIMETLERVDHNKGSSKAQIQDFVEQWPAVVQVNYCTPDGKVNFSSSKSRFQWQSNLLNRKWYRKFIKEWKPLTSPAYQSPVSPFPTVISFAVPKSIKGQIDGFWLVDFDVKKLNTFLPGVNNENEKKYSVWYDASGTILSTTFPNTQGTELAKDWWFSANRENADPLELLKDENSDGGCYYATDTNELGGMQILVVQPAENALAYYNSLESRIILLAIILQMILVLGTVIIFSQWQKQKMQFGLVSEQAHELQDVNDLLEARTEEMLNTNKKLDLLTGELSEQKNDLLKANYTLQKLHRFLNFLASPVITLKENLDVDYLNRAAENEFERHSDQAAGKSIWNMLDVSDRKEVVAFFKRVKKNSVREELRLTLNSQESTKKYLLSCDYLTLPEWNGYVLSLVDLTDLLSLQHEIESQNRFLDQSFVLVKEFLKNEETDIILDTTLGTIQKYAGAKAVYYYQVQGNTLSLKNQTPKAAKNPIRSLPVQGSIAGSTLVNGKPAVITDSRELPENITAPEKNWSFQSAVFKPVILNQQATGVVILINPGKEILNNYENTLARLLVNFEIGLSALLSQQELAEKSRLLAESADFRSQLLQTTTHGLNTPLSTVKGYAKLLKLKFGDILENNTELMDYVQKLDLATDDMANKISLFLDLARINRNDLKFNLQNIPLSALLDPVRDALSREAETRSIKLVQKNGSIKSQKIVIDTRRYLGAIQTVFLNALRFAPAEDKVIIDYALRESCLEISLEDHGPRIKKENIHLIGSEFIPSELSGERIHSENNLTMALAVKLIKLADGDLQVTSTKSKTVHKLRLPIKQDKKYAKSA